LLIIGAIVLVATNFERIREIYLFAGVLLLQSLPFLAAAAIASLEGSRVNEFAFWRSVEARFGEMLPRRGAMKAPAAAENRVETTS